MLSSASKYAIRSVLYMAGKRADNKKFGAAEVAKELELSTHFVAKLLQQLAKAGVISSLKGPTGGYYLSEENLQLKICDVIAVMEGDRVFEGCFLGLPECDGDHPCPLHDVFSDFRKKVLYKFSHQSIGELAKDISEDGTYLSLKGLI